MKREYILYYVKFSHEAQTQAKIQEAIASGYKVREITKFKVIESPTVDKVILGDNDNYGVTEAYEAVGIKVEDLSKKARPISTVKKVNKKKARKAHGKKKKQELDLSLGKED